MHNKALIATATIIIVAVLAATAIVSTNQNNTSTRQSDQNVSEPTEATATETDNYVVYEEGVLEEIDQPIVLFFHAVWCSLCVALERDIKTNGVPERYTFVQVDFDQHQQMRQRYGVTLQTTLIKLDENLEEIDRMTADREPTIAAVEQELL